jgi:hypothetical protein
MSRGGIETEVLETGDKRGVSNAVSGEETEESEFALKVPMAET